MDKYILFRKGIYLLKVLEKKARKLSYATNCPYNNILNLHNPEYLDNYISYLKVISRLKMQDKARREPP